MYNVLVEKIKKIERNNSLVDVYLKKRFDLIPNLVEVCKGYSKHEKETLEKVTE
jgi:LemA protein